MLERAQPLLVPEDFELIKGLVDTLMQVTKLVRERGSTIIRLRRLFGLSGSEKTRDVVGPSETTALPPPAVGQATEERAATPTGDAEPPKAAGVGATPEPPAKNKRKGHGRVAAADYLAAEHIV